VARARQFPGQEKAVWDYYKKNPQALAEIRAPIFEEKVVDHILGQVAIVDKPVTKEALLSEDDEDEAPAKPAKAKKAAAADEGAVEAKPAKAPAKKAKKAE
jgi:trigger factor